MFKTCPDPIDVQDLQFKLHCRLKVFDNKELDSFPKLYSLISCASRYGLLFIGCNSSNLQVIQLKCVENYSIKDKDISNYPRRNLNLSSVPLHIAVNCDSTILAVVTERENCASVTFYDVLSFFKQNISIVKEVRLTSTPGVYVREIGWNPALPPIFTACKSDGTLGVYEINGTSVNINELPAASEATCFCWSPKGKQIAVGSKNSRITQYKPDLKAVKVINQPPLEGGHSLISLRWVSNYQFIGIYQSVDSEGSAKLVVVDAPKVGDPVYTNYEDVCYSGSSRLPQFFMNLQSHWNLLMVASSNSTELGVLGSTGDTWTQWIISDSARAELPLSSDHQETLPLGLDLDISSTRPLPWNESTIPPCPYLLILSHHGVLCLFNVINLKDGIPSICTPPDPVTDLSGLQQFVTSSGNTAQNIEPPKPATPNTFTIQNVLATQAPLFGTKVLAQPQPTYSETLLASTPSDNKPLFGSQTTLTPIKPQQSTAQTLFGGQSFIAPVAKQQTTAAVTPAEKYSSIFSALNAPAPVLPPAESKTVLISTQNLSKPTPQVQQPVIVQPKATTVVPVTEVEPPKVAVTLKMKEETDILLAQMVRDDCVSLESELKALLHQGRSLNVNIGSENEKIELITKIDSLQEFIKEIVDISIGENAEVHSLKQNLIQSWAWYEEARSRYNASKDETVSLLLRSQPLDSATEKKQADIRRMMFYIDSQITQASKALDEQWDNFQDYAKKVHRTKMPTMETIFQAMVRQNAILQKQTYVMKDIASRLKGRGHSTNISTLLLSVETVNDVEASLNRLKIEHPQDIYKVQYERVLNRMKNLSDLKTKKLRKLLRNREVLYVTAVKHQLSSSLMLQSPESKSKRLLSNLATQGTPTSPVLTTVPVPKALSFVHSTPIRESKPNLKPAEIVPVTTQPDTKTFTFKKIEKTNLPAANSFIPLVKSASIFGNLPQEGMAQTPIATHTPSAFVPTQVNFGGSSKLNFATTATTMTTSVAKTVAISTTPASTGTYLHGNAATSTLPKFGGSASPKTPVTTASAKPSLSQFSFGSSLSITPVSTTKTASTTIANTINSTFGTVAMTKPSFSFAGTSSLFGAKYDPQTIPTSTSNLFGNTAQSNKPFSGSSSSFAIPTTSKFSAFSAVTTSSSTLTMAGTSAKPEEISSTKPPAFANTATTVISPKLSSVPTLTSVPSSPTVATTAGIFSTPTAATKPLSIPQTSVPSASATEIPNSSILTSTTKQSLAFGSAPTDITVNTASSTFTKPTSATSPNTGAGTATQSLFFGGNVAPNINSTVSDSTPIMSTSSTTKPSILAASTTTSQSSSQTSFFGTATSQSQSSDVLQSLMSLGTSLEPSSSTQPATQSIFAGAATVTSLLPGMVTTTQSASVFGSKTVTTIQSSGVSSTVTTTPSSIFGGTQSTTVTTLVTGAITQSTSSFGSKTVTTGQSSIFGSTVPTTQSSFFGGTLATTQSSLFGGNQTSTSAQPSFFGGNQSTSSGVSSSTQPSIFGGMTTTSTTSQPSSIFGSSNPTSTTQTSIFGAAVVPTQSSIFGGTQSAKTTTSQSSLFGNSSSGSTSKPSAFGSPSISNQSSPFGTIPTSNTQQNPLFGSGANTGSTSIFGSVPVTAQTSIFGGAKSASTTKSSIFGGSQTTTTQNSIFGTSNVPSTQSSIFGTAGTAAPPFGSSTLSSPFGQANPAFGAPKTTASTFGTGFVSPSRFNNTPSSTSSIFGQPASFGNTSTPAFGTPTTATNAFSSPTSTFGANTSANVFGSPATSSTSSFSFAGGANNATSTGSFGFGGLNVGNPATTNNSFGGSSPFGQAAVANPFNRATEQKSPFGGGNASVFGNPASSSGSIFGSNTGSTFSSNTQGGFGSSNFGSSTTFGQQSTFGQNSFGNTSFGSTQPGPFSGGSGAVAQTGFGSPTSFSKPSGFGSPPAFGGSPQAAFGAAPSFGGAPAFGAAPAFGSPNKIFGANTPSAGFGTASTAGAGFGNLANQNTVGFGSLAQQAAAPNAAPFSGSSSFSSWR